MNDKKPIPSKKIHFSEGNPQNLGRSTNMVEPLRQLIDRFRDPLVTREKFHQYKKMSDSRQAHLKNAGGWYMPAPTQSGTRKKNAILPRDLITLDIDYATPEFLAKLQSVDILPGVFYFIHTTRSHTPEKPRVRMLIPVAEKIHPEDYPRVCRIIADLVDPGLKHIDKVSARIAQMMYYPTVSVDMEEHYVFHVQGGELLDWETEVEGWEALNGDSLDLSNLPRFAGEGELRLSAEKAEDPREKDGPVGTFCRAYAWSDLIDTADGLLADLYEVTERKDGVPTRATYSLGTSSNGAVIYDDAWMFSHHGSDPTQDQLVNAWDACRMHLHGGDDDDLDEPMSQRKSWKAMVEFAKGLPGYQAQLTEERYDIDHMFSDDDDMSWAQDDDENEEGPDPSEIEDLIGVPVDSLTGGGPDRYKRQKAEKPPKNWVGSELDLTQDGAIKSTLHNVATIVTNDPRFFHKIAYNEHSGTIMLLRSIKTKGKTIPDIECHDTVNGIPWRDDFDLVVRAICDAPNGQKKPGYGFKPSQADIVGGITLAARLNAYHPVKERIEKWREMGPPDRDVVKGFLKRHCGAADDVYTNQVLRLWLIAAVARIVTPGHKFDFAPIFEGPQGIGKSTLIKCLFGAEFFGEIDCDLKSRRDVAEQIAGKWCCELPELSSLHKADHNDAKHFMRRQHDDVREAYGRRVEPKPRQLVTAGTTNDDKYLRDPTGNRSYWPIKCGPKPIDFAAVLREREDLWRQIVWEYDQMRLKQPQGDLPLYLKGEAAEVAQRLQERARKKELWEDWLIAVEDWMATPCTIGALADELNLDLLDLPDDLSEDTKVFRIAFTQELAFEKALGLREGKPTNPIQHTAWEQVVEALRKQGWQMPENAKWIAGTRTTGTGRRSRWKIIPEATEADMARGFIFSDMAEPTPNSDDDEASDLI